MTYLPQQRVAATYMRGGTSKGVFFKRCDLPLEAQQPGPERDALLLRAIGSPDPYGKQTDGMGGATSSTSKTVIVDVSQQPDHDVDYLFGQVAIDRAFVDWSGNCGNLSAAVGAFAIAQGLVSPERVPQNGVAEVRIWQKNISKTIITKVHIHNGEVKELGEFELDGVTFPAEEIEVAFLDPVDGGGQIFPTGNAVDQLTVPGHDSLSVTMINAGIPTVFFNASDLGFSGTELQDDINNDVALLEKLELFRAHAAMRMGLIKTLDEAKQRQHTPKIAWVASPEAYTASSGKRVNADAIDVLIRAMSMGKLHHAMMGTAAVAIAAAAAIEGTLVNIAAGGIAREAICFGHPSGTLTVGARAELCDGAWHIERAVMGRSARVLMEGYIRIPKVW
ncbi:2-methylaconitate cis-trans isomerase PrpF [uncultured Umboniibacter sp.]|uniref:2-methylaconitate cis-trans isomerase PrpF n=1 Tax=uncultured Umboniibacter sp. TaxID=1798917 RepID=UPI002613E616|nr:2-methylaconitate cis-trans isomerase PrpF [uncultured Umboniibacter sp.]